MEYVRKRVCYAEHAQEHKNHARNGDSHLYPRTRAQRERELCEFKVSLTLLSSKSARGYIVKYCLKGRREYEKGGDIYL